MIFDKNVYKGWSGKRNEQICVILDIWHYQINAHSFSTAFENLILHILQQLSKWKNAFDNMNSAKHKEKS